jgi:hypothetical protein
MDLKTLGTEVAKIGLPLLGAALPIPGGMAIGAALASAIGSPSTQPEDILATLTGNAQAIAQAKQFELTHQEAMLKITLDSQTAQYQAEVADRDSARKLAAQQPNDFMRPLLALVLMTLTAYIVWAVMGGHADSVIKDTTAALTVGTLIGYVLSEAKQVLGFYFGMTQDGARTNAVVRDFAVAPGAVTAPSAAAPPLSVSPSSLSTAAPAPSTEQAYSLSPGAQGDIYRGS